MSTFFEKKKIPDRKWSYNPFRPALNSVSSPDRRVRSKISITRSACVRELKVMSHCKQPVDFFY